MLSREKDLPCIAIMMSTYNGEKYLREQIDSILLQKGIHVELYIRDDGSKDGTVNILHEYGKKDNVHIKYGFNSGVIESFLKLLYEVPRDYEYYAFSDQDDVWLEDKLIIAVKQLEGGDGPRLYFSRKTYVDEKLQKIDMNDIDVRDTTIGIALMNSCASGCTMVFNKRLLNKLCKYRPDSKQMSMHDSWIYIVAAAIGKVIYDDESRILYRQHGGNVSGINTYLNNRFLERWKTRFINIKKRKSSLHRSYYAVALLQGYSGELPKDVYDLVYDLANVRNSYLARLRIVLSGKLQTQKPLDIYFLKIFILLGWI